MDTRVSWTSRSARDLGRLGQPGGPGQARLTRPGSARPGAAQPLTGLSGEGFPLGPPPGQRRPLGRLGHPGCLGSLGCRAGSRNFYTASPADGVDAAPPPLHVLRSSDLKTEGPVRPDPLGPRGHLGQLGQPRCLGSLGCPRLVPETSRPPPRRLEMARPRTPPPRPAIERLKDGGERKGVPAPGSALGSALGSAIIPDIYVPRQFRGFVSECVHIDRGNAERTYLLRPRWRGANVSTHTTLMR